MPENSHPHGDVDKQKVILDQGPGMTNNLAGFLSGTDLLHADDKYRENEVSPSISVTTSKLASPPPDRT